MFREQLSFHIPEPGSFPTACSTVTTNANEIVCVCVCVCVYFKILFVYFRQRGREGERGEKHQCVVASRTPLLGT